MSGPDRVTAARLVSVFSDFETQRLNALATMAGLYDSDMQFQDPIQTVRGRDAFLEMNRRLVQRSRRIAFVIRDVVETDEQIVLTWLMILVPKIGRELQFEGVSHCKLKDGVIVYQRDYWDLASSLLRNVPILGTLYGKFLEKLG